MANEPKIIGDSPLATAGWRIVHDYRMGTGTLQRVRHYAGPALSVDDMVAAIMAGLHVVSIEPSVTIGSAVATLRVVYVTIAMETSYADERRPPQYQINPRMVTEDIRGHVAYESGSVPRMEIEKLISSGDIEALKTLVAGNEAADRLARLLVAGYKATEHCAFDLVCTRYYKSAPNISADFTLINKVYTWADIRTHGKAIPASVPEPKYVDHGGAARGFEWRLVGVAPVIQRNVENVVTWTFSGAEAWPKWLYSGGTWEPPAL